jgi:hypothetical protein
MVDMLSGGVSVGRIVWRLVTRFYERSTGSFIILRDHTTKALVLPLESLFQLCKFVSQYNLAGGLSLLWQNLLTAFSYPDLRDYSTH